MNSAAEILGVCDNSINACAMCFVFDNSSTRFSFIDTWGSSTNADDTYAEINTDTYAEITPQKYQMQVGHTEESMNEEVTNHQQQLQGDYNRITNAETSL